MISRFPNSPMQMNPNNNYGPRFAPGNNMQVNGGGQQQRPQLGDPMMQDISIFDTVKTQSPMMQLPNFDFNQSEGADNDMPKNNLMQKIMDFFKGFQGAQQPQGMPQQGPEGSIFNGDGAQGPQKPGDPQPHLGEEQGNTMPQFNFFNQQPEADFDFGNEESSMPPKGQDPDSYAKSYAQANGMSFEEAKAALQAKYGDPEQ